VQFGGRIVAGALAGAAIGIAARSWSVGAELGAVGAIIGTFGGAELRRRLALAFHKDRPAALIEDAAAVGGAVLVAGVLV
jgi:uncharacterized membrane protein